MFCKPLFHAQIHMFKCFNEENIHLNHAILFAHILRVVCNNLTTESWITFRDLNFCCSERLQRPALVRATLLSTLVSTLYSAAPHAVAYLKSESFEYTEKYAMKENKLES